MALKHKSQLRFSEVSALLVLSASPIILVSSAPILLSVRFIYLFFFLVFHLFFFLFFFIPVFFLSLLTFSLVIVLLIFNDSLNILAPSIPILLTVHFIIVLSSFFISLFYSFSFTAYIQFGKCTINIQCFTYHSCSFCFNLIN